MGSCAKLDAPRGARRAQLIFLFLGLTLGWPTFGQQNPPDAARLNAAQKAFDSGRWDEATELSQGPENQGAELDFLHGLALAKQEHWDESRLAFVAGHRKSPNDPRFLVELAGIDYKQNNYSSAKRNLRAALQLGSRDTYTSDFLGTIYFVQGNLEAALKYWNAIDKPRLRNVDVEPTPRLQEPILRRAVAFNAPQVLSGNALLTTHARLENLGTFSQERMELAPAGENFDAHTAPRGTQWLAGFQAGRGDSAVGRTALRDHLSRNLQSRPARNKFHFVAALGFRKAPGLRNVVDTGVRQSGTSLADLLRCAQRELELEPHVLREHGAE